jgi:hypothetical protein
MVFKELGEILTLHQHFLQSDTRQYDLYAALEVLLMYFRCSILVTGAGKSFQACSLVLMQHVDSAFP